MHGVVGARPRVAADHPLGRQEVLEVERRGDLAVVGAHVVVRVLPVVPQPARRRRRAVPQAVHVPRPGEIEAIAAGHAARPEARLGQQRLADEATRIVHGEEGLAEARRTTETLFGDQPFAELDDDVLSAAFDSVPVAEFDRARLDNGGVGLLEVLVAVGAARSNGEARRLVEGGGVLLNNARVDDPGAAARPRRPRQRDHGGAAGGEAALLPGALLRLSLARERGRGRPLPDGWCLDFTPTFATVPLPTRSVPQRDQDPRRTGDAQPLARQTRGCWGPPSRTGGPSCVSRRFRPVASPGSLGFVESERERC